MKKNSENLSMQDAMRLAQSDAGQQLLSLLKAMNGEQLQKAANDAAAGDYDSIRRMAAALSASPEAKALLDQLRRQSNE